MLIKNKKNILIIFLLSFFFNIQLSADEFDIQAKEIIVDKENQLPPQIKANILSLSIFVDRQTIKALAETKKEHVDVLIGINKNLAEGLMIRADQTQVEPSTASSTVPAAQPDVSV